MQLLNEIFESRFSKEQLEKLEDYFEPIEGCDVQGLAVPFLKACATLQDKQIIALWIPETNVLLYEEQLPLRQKEVVIEMFLENFLEHPNEIYWMYIDQ